MSQLARVTGPLKAIMDSERSNLERLFPDEQFQDSDFVWEPSFSGLTHIEVGVRMTKKAATDMGLKVDDVRQWPDGRSYLAIPLPIDAKGNVRIPKLLASRQDWFLLYKAITRTACSQGSKKPFYVCCLAGNGRELYKIDSPEEDRGNGTRSHSVAVYLTYGQKPDTCQAGTEENVRPVEPMTLIHLMRERGDPQRINVILQRLTLHRYVNGVLCDNPRKMKESQRAAAGLEATERGYRFSSDVSLSFKFELEFLNRSVVEEKDPNDGHGRRILPADIKKALTGQYEGLTDMVRNAYWVLAEQVTIPIYANQFDPRCDILMNAIFGEEWRYETDKD